MVTWCAQLISTHSNCTADGGDVHGTHSITRDVRCHLLSPASYATFSLPGLWMEQRSSQAYSVFKKAHFFLVCFLVTQRPCSILPVLSTQSVDTKYWTDSQSFLVYQPWELSQYILFLLKKSEFGLSLMICSATDTSRPVSKSLKSVWFLMCKIKNTLISKATSSSESHFIVHVESISLKALIYHSVCQ